MSEQKLWEALAEIHDLAQETMGDYIVHSCLEAHQQSVFSVILRKASEALSSDEGTPGPKILPAPSELHKRLDEWWTEGGDPFERIEQLERYLQSASAAPQEGKGDLRARIRLRANMIVRDHELQPQIIDVITDAMESVLTTREGGWCRRCGCGNDSLGYAHLPTCSAAPQSGKKEDGHEKMKATDEQIREWAERHDIASSMTDLRCMFEDAQTLAQTPPAPSSPPSKAEGE